MTGGASCRLCGGGPLQPHREVEAGGATRRFVECESCGSILDDAGVRYDYAGERPAGADAMAGGIPYPVKFHVEVGASIDDFAQVLGLLRRAFPDGRRLLDVGTGFGFLVALAARSGWDAVGVEPSDMGEIGARLLGVPILREYLEESDLPTASFDVAVSSEVIEHAADPDRFVALLARYLKADGALLLTTPNAEALTAARPEPEWREMLSPGSHVNVFSPAALRLVLERNGFADVRFHTSGGSSGRKRLRVLAARTAGRIPAAFDFAPTPADERAVSEFLAALAARKEAAGELDAVYLGALFRLVERLVNRDDPEAGPAIEKLDAVLARTGVDEESLGRLQAGDLPDYLRQVPAFAGLYQYYRGIYALNRAADYDAAARRFLLAEGLLALEKSLGHYPRAGWPQRALFHRALALQSQGRTAEAGDIRAALAADPETPDDLVARLTSAVEPRTQGVLTVVAPLGTGRRRLLRAVRRRLSPGQ